eukprot:3939517-Rhodomonas_salina.2
MDAILDFVSDMCDITRRGGRCTSNNVDAVEVSDIDRWTDEMTRKLLHHFPACSVDCVSATQSLNGFKIVIRNRGYNTLVSSGMLLLTMIFCTCLVVQWILHDVTPKLQ